MFFTNVIHVHDGKSRGKAGKKIEDLYIILLPRDNVNILVFSSTILVSSHLSIFFLSLPVHNVLLPVFYDLQNVLSYFSYYEIFLAVFYILEPFLK